MSNVPLILFNGGALLVVLASVACWVVAYRKWRRGEALIPPEPRRAVPWGFLHLLLAFAIASACSLAASGLVSAWTEVPPKTPLAEMPVRAITLSLTLLALSTFAGVAGALLMMKFAAGATANDLGLSIERIQSDLRLGVVAFVALAPPVYAVQMALIQFVQSEHPLIQVLEQDRSLGLIMAVVATAVIAAPIAEELVFRLFLQGWLERVALPAEVRGDLLVGRSSSLAVSKPAADVVTTPQGGALQCWWPIVASSALFALPHAAHGPDPIPLFILALGLGYLYRQTHRILPCIVVHFLLNSCTLLSVLLLLD